MTTQCIPWPWVCDGDRDCSSGNDEKTNLCKNIGACGGNFTASSGLLTSPSYPDNYPASKECVYIISLPSSTFLDLSFHMFDLRKKYQSIDDNIEIRDGGSEASPLIGSFFKNSIPKFTQTTKNKVWMK